MDKNALPITNPHILDCNGVFTVAGDTGPKWRWPPTCWVPRLTSQRMGDHPLR